MDDVSTQSSNGLSEKIERASFKEYRLICLNGDYTKFFIFCICIDTICTLGYDRTMLARKYIEYIKSKMDPENDNIFVSLNEQSTHTETLRGKLKEMCTIISLNKRYYLTNTVLVLLVINCIYERFINS